MSTGHHPELQLQLVGPIAESLFNRGNAAGLKLARISPDPTRGFFDRRTEINDAHSQGFLRGCAVDRAAVVTFGDGLNHAAHRHDCVRYSDGDRAAQQRF
jgi:hypothetical protein